jgi:hypothetical protein
MSEAPPLDRDAVEAITGRLLGVIREHYLMRPRNRAAVLEVLNGLGLVAALVVVGTEAPPDEVEKLRSFIIETFDNQVTVGKPKAIGEMN